MSEITLKFGVGNPVISTDISSVDPLDSLVVDITYMNSVTTELGAKAAAEAMIGSSPTIGYVGVKYAVSSSYNVLVPGTTGQTFNITTRYNTTRHHGNWTSETVDYSTTQQALPDQPDINFSVPTADSYITWYSIAGSIWTKLGTEVISS